MKIVDFLKAITFLFIKINYYLCIQLDLALKIEAEVWFGAVLMSSYPLSNLPLNSFPFLTLNPIIAKNGVPIVNFWVQYLWKYQDIPT